MKQITSALTLVLSLMSAPALLASDLMTAEEFDAFTRGKTFYYGFGGEAYGAEEYLPNNRVIWTFLDGRCQNGIWYEEGGMICFEYENIEDRQCWSFREGDDGGLVARFQNDPEELELYEVQRSGEPLQCPGPEVGV
jgi:hypothetical protein